MSTSKQRKSEAGRKNDGEKLRFDLIPVLPMYEVAKVYTIGAKKYDDRNWEKGITWSRLYGAMLRHALAWWSGQRDDQDDGQHHLASVVWTALALMEYERTHPELDDRPGSLKGEAKIMRYDVPPGTWHNFTACSDRCEGHEENDPNSTCPCQCHRSEG